MGKNNFSKINFTLFLVTLSTLNSTDITVGILRTKEEDVPLFTLYMTPGILIYVSKVYFYILPFFKNYKRKNIFRIYFLYFAAILAAFMMFLLVATVFKTSKMIIRTVKLFRQRENGIDNVSCKSQKKRNSHEENKHC